MRLAMSVLLVLAMVLTWSTHPATAQGAATVRTTGVVLEVENGELIVAGILDGSPAAAAGMVRGDVVTEVSGGGRGMDKVQPGTMPFQAQRITDAQGPVTFRLKGGRVVTLAPADVVATPSMGNRVSCPEGQLRSVDGSLGKAFFPVSGRVGTGDEFLVFQGSLYGGIAHVQRVDGGTFFVHVRQSAQVRATRRSRPPGPESMTGVGRSQEVSLEGARLVLLRHGSGYFESVVAGRAPDGRNPHYIIANPVVSDFTDRSKRGEYKVVLGGRVSRCNPGAGMFTVSWRQGHSMPGPGGRTITTTVNLSAPPITLDIVYGPQTRVLISADMRDASVDGRSRLKDGCTAKVFYRPEGNLNRAYLIIVNP